VGWPSVLIGIRVGEIYRNDIHVRAVFCSCVRFGEESWEWCVIDGNRFKDRLIGFGKV
jgi:hypothetical protein